MNSDDLEIDVWVPFNLRQPDEVGIFPREPGVYIIKMPKPICRAKGESDIAYIGEATGVFGLWGRTRDHLADASSVTTSGRVRQWLDWRDDLQIGYIVSDDPKGLEKHLLEHFDEEHFELPAINRRMG